VVASCDDLTDHQRALVRDFPGRVVEMPDLADPQVRVQTDADFAILVQRVPEGAAVHVVRYDYDDAADAVAPLERLELSIRLPETFSRAEAISPAGDLRAALTADGERHELVLEAVPLYGVVLLRP
jgi:hypothetical protein